MKKQTIKKKEQTNPPKKGLTIKNTHSPIDKDSNRPDGGHCVGGGGW